IGGRLQFHTFLLYGGPVVLLELLPETLCEHFLVLHTAIRTLASPKLHIEFNDYAKNLLKYFVQQFGKIYGQNQLVYNVHTLSHLAKQCLKHGPLDGFSAFSFESCLGRLKKKLRTTSKPLAQISRRLSEAK
ncbi:PrC protein, putative, partial [Ixodes scapularis]